jgi:endo-1,4-beta-xylanase
MHTRRETLRYAFAGVAAATCGLPIAACSADSPARSGAPYGVAIRPSLLATDLDYRTAVIANCDMIVTEGGMLWHDIRPARDVFEFTEPDAAAAFAVAHGMQMRGHTLVWYGVMPGWTQEIATAAEAERELTEHIQRVVSRYRGIIRSWNVVNEPLIDDPSGPHDLRPLIWKDRLGADYIAIALRAAHTADPNASLVINEYDIEFVGPRFRRKRLAFAALIRDLVDRGAPLHGVGVQGHLRGELEIDREGLADFSSQMKALGLSVLVTELDVLDDKLPPDIGARDAVAASRVLALLSGISEGAPLSAIVTWGITDKYTWTPMYYKRADGLPNRPLPLDLAYQAKPFMEVISRFRHSRG